MSINFLELLKNQLTGGSTLGAISNFLGESEAATKTGLGATLPTLLGSVIQAGSTPSGASSLLNLIKSGGYDGSALTNVAGLLSGGDATKNFLNGGSSLVSTLFGANAGKIASLLGGATGLGNGSVSSLLSMAAPLVMSMIGKHTASTGLGAAGLSSLLSSQASTVNAALPPGISNLLGFANTSSNINPTANTVVDTSTDGFNFWPWLIGAAAVLLALYAWKSCGTTPEMKTPAVVEKAADKMSDATSTAVAKVAEMFKVTLPGGVALEAPKGSLEDKLVTFIQSKDTVSKTLWFDFDRLTFETGKTVLKPESGAQLANIAAILKAFPKVTVKVGGYTDNVGKPADNLKLSTARAKAVAAELTKLGIAATRLDPEGYGDQHPVASNETEAGKAQNRRIALRVKTK